MLRWARERAGLELPAVAERIPQLPAWERGDMRPTLRQLEEFARATHVPIGFLFLADPPDEPMPIPDFRTVANVRIARPSPDLLDTLYLCQQRQEWYRDWARANREERHQFVGSVQLGSDVTEAARRIREALGFDVVARRECPTWTEALRRFIGQADDLGVLVMVSGVVGSNNHRKLIPGEFRGFALADDMAPLVFINGADSRAAQMFTLAHELAHIWLGQTALSDAGVSEAPAHEIERWCNLVAAELLVPMDQFRVAYHRRAPLTEELGRLARVFKVSTLVVLRRIFDAGFLGREAYWEAYHEECARLNAFPGTGGGNFYLTLGARASRRFARAVISSALEGRSPYTDAFRLLGFRSLLTFHEMGRNLGLVT